MRWNGDTTNKNKLFFPISFGRGRSQGICGVCYWQGIFHVILRLTSVNLDHLQKRKIMEVNGKSA